MTQFSLLMTLMVGAKKMASAEALAMSAMLAFRKIAFASGHSGIVSGNYSTFVNFNPDDIDGSSSTKIDFTVNMKTFEVTSIVNGIERTDNIAMLPPTVIAQIGAKVVGDIDFSNISSTELEELLDEDDNASNDDFDIMDLLNSL